MRRIHMSDSRGFVAGLAIWLTSVCAAVAGVPASATPDSAVRLTDLAGREVVVPQPVTRILLGEGRLLNALAVLEGPALTERLVALPDDLERVDPGSHAQYLAAFPMLATIPRVGHGASDGFDLEQALMLRPDLAVFSRAGHGPAARDKRLVEQLERAGVAVLFVDFREDPLTNTPPSMLALGQALGREAVARRFVDAYAAALSAVTDRLDPAAPRPTVFLHSRAGLSDTCCDTMVRGMLADLVEAAGGRNLAAGRIPGQTGTVSLEGLLIEPPDVYVATAIGSAADVQQAAYVSLGPGVAAASARASLEGLLQRSRLDSLPAVRTGRAHAIWHVFYNNPFNVVALQVLAGWIDPARFDDLDPRATLETLYREFMPFALDGDYWVSR